MSTTTTNNPPSLASSTDSAMSLSSSASSMGSNNNNSTTTQQQSQKNSSNATTTTSIKNTTTSSSNATTTNTATPTSSSSLDSQIERLKRCEYLRENEVKALCLRAREILVDEGNVQRVDAPVTVCFFILYDVIYYWIMCLCILLECIIVHWCIVGYVPAHSLTSHAPRLPPSQTNSYHQQTNNNIQMIVIYTYTRTHTNRYVVTYTVNFMT